MNSKRFKSAIKRLLPNKKVNVSLFIVGAQKAGTSALHNYLIKHPYIQGGVKKEINFFNHRDKLSKGVNWYHKQYSPVLFYKPKPIYIDSTPQYLNDINIAEKIHEYNPNSKIVILLREPVSRAFSAWNMYRQFSELNAEEKNKLIEHHVSLDLINKFRNLIDQSPFPSFDAFIERELTSSSSVDTYPSILKRGVYVDQVKAYLDTFGLDNVMIFESNYFKNNKVEVTNSILGFLGLSNLNLKENRLKPIHSRKYESPISMTAKEKLKEYYKPYNESLFTLINQKFDW